MIRKVGDLLTRFVHSPRQTIQSLPDLAESVRMRLRGDSTFRRKQDILHAASHCPRELIDRLLDLWRPASVLDIGCGPGVALDYLLERGITDLKGVEGSALAIQSARHPAIIQQADLAQPLDLKRKFDMVYTVEVAEHIRPGAADTFVDTCTRHADRIVFTAAHPGQGGMGHLNEQPPDYWISKFDQRGFRYEPSLTQTLRPLLVDHPQNLMIFVR